MNFFEEINKLFWRELDLSVMESQQKGIKRPRLTFTSEQKKNIFLSSHKKSNLAELILAGQEKIKIGEKKFLRQIRQNFFT